MDPLLVIQRNNNIDRNAARNKDLDSHLEMITTQTSQMTIMKFFTDVVVITKRLIDVEPKAFNCSIPKVWTWKQS